MGRPGSHRRGLAGRGAVHVPCRHDGETPCRTHAGAGRTSPATRSGRASRRGPDGRELVPSPAAPYWAPTHTRALQYLCNLAVATGLFRYTPRQRVGDETPTITASFALRAVFRIGRGMSVGLDDLLLQEGAVARRLEGFEVRPQQIEMAAAVQRTLEQRGSWSSRPARAWGRRSPT